jgi:hypothetical protein
MVKYLNFGDSSSSFCLKILFNVNGKATHTPCYTSEGPTMEAVNLIRTSGCPWSKATVKSPVGAPALPAVPCPLPPGPPCLALSGRSFSRTPFSRIPCPTLLGPLPPARPLPPCPALPCLATYSQSGPVLVFGIRLSGLVPDLGIRLSGPVPLRQLKRGIVVGRTDKRKHTQPCSPLLAHTVLP